MILRLYIGRWRFTFSMAPLTKVVGVHSICKDGMHILMWDFDDVKLMDILKHLVNIQHKYKLSKIYILQTKKNTNYIAYCFTKVTWQKAVEIVAQCPYIDYNFFKYSVYRGKFSLRVTPKCGRKIHMATVIFSEYPATATPRDLADWVKYETFEDGFKHKKINLEICKDDYS